MKEDKQKWLRLDGDDGWQIILPDTDIKPHAVNQTPTKLDKEERDLAWIDCPCKPKIDVGDKIIIHNSFEDKKRIDESMVVNLYENPAEMDL